jgi:BASS family bile acid:Na+ symporter
MVEILSKAFPFVVLAQLIGTMLSSGLSLTPSQLVRPFRSVRLTVSAVVANYILVPVIASLLARLFGLDEPIRYGLVLLAMVAGAESVPLLTMNAKGNVGLAVGLLVTSMLINIFYVPFMLSLFMKDIHIDKIPLLIRLCLTVALPIAIGLVVKAVKGNVAAFLAPLVKKFANIAMMSTVVLIFYLNYSKIFSLFGTRAIAVGFIYVIITFFLGYVLGGPERANRAPMGFWMGARNASLTMFLASTLFAAQRQVLVMASVTIIIMIVLALPTSFWLGRRAAQATAEAKMTV